MRIWSLVVSLLTVMAVSTTGAFAYRLTYKDTPGATRTYQAIMNVDGTMDMMGMSTPMDGTTSFTMVEQVLDAVGDTATIAYEMRDGDISMNIMTPNAAEPMKMNMKMPGMSMTYDRSALGAISNLQFEGEMADMMQGLSGANPMQSMMNPGQGLAFPDRDLAIGDVWMNSDTITMNGMEMTIDVENRLADVRVVNGKTLLQVVSDMTMTMPPMTITVEQGNGMKVTTEMEMRGTTTTWFDETNGELYEANIDMDMTMNSTTSGGEQPMDMKMVMKTTGAIKKAN